MIYSGQNGYLVYFSDRRGMLPDPNGTPAEYHQRRIRLRRRHQLGVADRNSGRSLGTAGRQRLFTRGRGRKQDAGCLGRSRCRKRHARIATVGNPYKTVDCLDWRPAEYCDRSAPRAYGWSMAAWGTCRCVRTPVWAALLWPRKIRFTSSGDYNSNAGDPFWGNPPRTAGYQSRRRRRDRRRGDVAFQCLVRCQPGMQAGRPNSMVNALT